jgi:hypothetical protein
LLQKVKLTIINGCGIVTTSFPVKPLFFRVKSGRNMKVFFMSNATVSCSSLSTKSVFSFHSLHVWEKRFLGRKKEEIKLNGLKFLVWIFFMWKLYLWKYFDLLEYVGPNLFYMRLCYLQEKFIDKIKIPFFEINWNFIVLKI